MTAPGPITVETATWPLVVVTFRGAPGDGELADMLAEYARCLARREPFFAVNDALGLAIAPNAAQRKLIAAGMKQSAEAARRWLVGAAAVISNPILYGVITAINWLSPFPCPISPSATLHEAVQIGVRTLATRGVQLSAETHRFQRRVELEARG